MSSTPASSSSIKKLAVRGAIWAILGYGASQALRFGNNLILTRLLEPELFGLMALVSTVIIGLRLFSDIGLQTNIVQSKRGDDPVFLNTAWTVQIIRGVVLWLGCVLIAFPAAQYYEERALLLLVPIVGLNTIISGFNSTAIFSLNRHLSVKQVAIYELSGQLFGAIVMLVWAWFDRTIWALVAGNVATAIWQLGYSHRINSGMPNRLTWDRQAVRELISFGKWIFISTVMTFLATQADRLILKKGFSWELLGIYGIAFTLADLPRSVMSAVSGKVIYPTYSKLIGLPRGEFRGKILRNRAPILAALAVGLALMVGFGDIIVNILYTDEYSIDAAWMLPLLALGTWPLMLTQTIEPVLFALGKPYYSAFASFLSFLCFVIGIPLGFQSPLQEVGAVMAVAVSNIPIWIVITVALRREKLSVLTQDIIMTALFTAILAVVLLGRTMLGLGVPLSGLL